MILFSRYLLNRVILQSFCTPGMQVQSVTVYPSDFGIARMKEEAIHGPPKELWKKNKLSKDEAESSQFESESDSGVEKDYSKCVLHSFCVCCFDSTCLFVKAKDV